MLKSVKIKKMNNISLGFSVGHSRGAAITIDGELRVAIANERITRIKTDHSDRIPMESIEYCLTALGTLLRRILMFLINLIK